MDVRDDCETPNYIWSSSLDFKSKSDMNEKNARQKAETCLRVTRAMWTCSTRATLAAKGWWVRLPVHVPTRHLLVGGSVATTYVRLRRGAYGPGGYQPFGLRKVGAKRGTKKEKENVSWLGKIQSTPICFVPCWEIHSTLVRRLRIFRSPIE